MLIFQPDDLNWHFSDDVPMTYRRRTDDLPMSSLPLKGYTERPGAARIPKGFARPPLKQGE